MDRSRDLTPSEIRQMVRLLAERDPVLIKGAIRCIRMRYDARERCSATDRNMERLVEKMPYEDAVARVAKFAGSFFDNMVPPLSEYTLHICPNFCHYMGMKYAYTLLLERRAACRRSRRKKSKAV